MGARPGSPGISAIHTHMTNTMNTPVEALEHSYPLQIEKYAIRSDQGERENSREETASSAPIDFCRQDRCRC